MIPNKHRARTLSFLLATSMLMLAARMASAAPPNTRDLSPDTSGRLRADPDAAAIAALPKDFRFVREGVLTVAIHPWVPPISTYATDARTVVGFDPDLAQLVADALGKKLELVPVAWADWPLGLSAGKFDVVLSNVTVTEERKERFDFATYRQDLLGFYVATGSAIPSIGKPADVAGLRVITDPGTNQERVLLNWDEQNRKAGLPPVDVQYYDDDSLKALALQSGRADAIFSVNATLAYKAAASGGKLRHAGSVPGGWPRTAEVAITTRKGSGLAAPLARALNGLIDQGLYAQALDRWQLSSEAVDQSRVNPPGLPKS